MMYGAHMEETVSPLPFGCIAHCKLLILLIADQLYGRDMMFWIRYWRLACSLVVQLVPS